LFKPNLPKLLPLTVRASHTPADNSNFQVARRRSVV
jgi:hypothetical protein